MQSVDNGCDSDSGDGAFLPSVHGLGTPAYPSITFTVLMIFRLMRGPLHEMPQLIVYFIDFFISMGRIQEFLEQDDVN